MQFDAQCRSYRAGFPDATDRIICLDGAAIGRILIAQNATTTRLIDIALLEVYRNRGIGTVLLRQLLQECEMQGRALRLQVLQGNRAIRFYQRLGFVQASADPMYAQMEWTAPSRLLERF
jgi:GNAT superfamily N-acetyltransferase